MGASSSVEYSEIEITVSKGKSNICKNMFRSSRCCSNSRKEGRTEESVEYVLPVSSYKMQTASTAVIHVLAYPNQFSHFKNIQTSSTASRSSANLLIIK